MKALFRIINFINVHPLTRNQKVKAYWRLLQFQIGKRFRHKPIIHALTSKVKIYVGKNMTGATGNLYCGLHEFEDMGFLLHFLRKGDLFVDVGSNVGSYTLLASGHIGAHTVAFEPVPSTYNLLLENIKLNGLDDLVHCYPVCVGDRKENVAFTSSLDTQNHIATGHDVDNTITVEMEMLDNVLAEKSPVLIKIDVEGFEDIVIKGAQESLKNSSLKALIVEMIGEVSDFSHKENATHSLLISNGFHPAKYNPMNRKLEERDEPGDGNTIYVRNFEDVQKRLQEGKPFTILHQLI